MLIYLICKSNTGPKPFKFFNYWLKCAGFVDVLKEAWAINVQGVPMYRVVIKLRSLKHALKQWCKDGKSSPSDKVLHTRKELAKVHEELQAHPLSSDLASKENKLQSELSFWLGLEEDMCCAPTTTTQRKP